MYLMEVRISRLKKSKTKTLEQEVQESLRASIENELSGNLSKEELNNAEDIMKEKPKKNKMNREIAVIFYCFIGLFAALMIYFTRYLIIDKSDILNNPYNKMQDILAERVTRGQILASGGEVLAETVVDKKGNETRSYPYDNLFAHTVGQFDNGKTGIESAYNLYMLTSDINPVVSAFNELQEKKNPGNNVVTTLDVSLQRLASSSLGQRKGAVIAMDPDTGAILAMVSKPDYNPNKVSSIWKTLINDENSALLNRASQGLYPPGSTFKLVTLLEYIRENPDYDNFNFTCKGVTDFGTSKINCYNNKKHGSETLIKAFAKSCNGAFAAIGSELDIKTYIDNCNKLLFNNNLPCSFAYKKSSFSLTEDSDIGEITQTAIGQGRTLITPLHNALLISSACNGGKLVTPHIVDRIENVNKKEVKDFDYHSDKTIMTKEESKVLDTYLHEVVNSGTATALKGRSYDAAGKTGSAEYDTSGASHAWFVGYAEKDGKKLAVSIVVEGAGTGSDYAVPIAKKLFDQYY